MKSTKVVGEICLYGTRDIGFGWLAQAEGRMFGDGEPRPMWTCTDCMFRGLEAIRNYGITKGIVRVFASGGELMADVQIGGVWPYYGDLKWSRATQMVVEIG